MGQTLVSDAVRVLMLTWEYPPLLVGGLGRHVEALAGQLVRAGHQVWVVTRGDKQEATAETVEGVRVVRAAVDPLAIDFTTESLLAWAQAAEHSLLRAALPVVAQWRPDIVHAHDWLVGQSAVTLGQVTGSPIVATMHATEAGRHQGWLPTPLNLAIHSAERWLAQSAAEVITCSTSMRDEVCRLFELDARRVTIVPNGIDPDAPHAPWAQRTATRVRLAPDAALIAFAGRLVHEKGLQTLIDSLPSLRASHPGLRLVVAGTGGHETKLRARARRLRVARAIEWAGFVDEEGVAALLGAADVAVVPSLYEPFGIVALEAAAARTPLIVADTGGLRDLATAGVAAGSFTPGDPPALAAAITAVLDDPAAARRAVRRAARVIRRDYSWPAVAAATTARYDRARGSSAT